MFCFFDHEECGIFVPWPGIENSPLHWKVKSQPLDHQGSPNMSAFETWMLMDLQKNQFPHLQRVFYF